MLEKLQYLMNDLQDYVLRIDPATAEFQDNIEHYCNSYLAWMLKECDTFENVGKRQRWLGYVKGVLACVMSIEANVNFDYLYAMKFYGMDSNNKTEAQLNYNIGFIQGMLVYYGFSTVEIERNRTRFWLNS